MPRVMAVVFGVVLALVAQTSAPLAPRNVRLLASSPSATVSPLDYGAKCDSATDDTDALKATITAADASPYRTIQLPPSRCVYRDTLTFGGHADRYASISVFGHSEYTSGLVYGGPMDRPAIIVNHMAAFTWSGFTVTTPQASTFSTHGTATGVLVTGPGTFGGTADSLMSFNHLTISGFKIGMLVGDVNAGSEMDCMNCNVQYNDIGWTANGYNSLNFWFYNLGLGGNTVGLQIGGSWATDAPHVVGGHSWGNTVADIQCANGFGVLSVENFRAEISTGAKFIKGEGCGHQLVIRHSNVVGQATVPVLDLAAWSNVTVENSLIIGQMQVVNQEKCSIHIEDTIVSEGTSGYPVVFPASLIPMKVRFIGNTKYWHQTPPYFPDVVGMWTNGTVQ